MADMACGQAEETARSFEDAECSILPVSKAAKVGPRGCFGEEARRDAPRS